MGKSIDAIDARTGAWSSLGSLQLPALILSMSLQPAIPWRVALQQSPTPLHRLSTMLKEKLRLEKTITLNGNCVFGKLSHSRGSPHRDRGCLIRTLRHQDRSLLNRTLRQRDRPSPNSRIASTRPIFAHLHFGASGSMFAQFRIEQSGPKMPQNAHRSNGNDDCSTARWARRTDLCPSRIRSGAQSSYKLQRRRGDFNPAPHLTSSIDHLIRSPSYGAKAKKGIVSHAESTGPWKPPCEARKGFVRAW